MSSSFHLGLIAVFSSATLFIASSACAAPAAPPATTPASASGNRPGPVPEPSPSERDSKGFHALAGLLIYPYTTDDTFGAGLQVGTRYEFAVLMLRENFLKSTQHAEDGMLVRLKDRFSFELSLEAQARLGHATLYGGFGGLMRHDAWEHTSIVDERFVSSRTNESLTRPFFIAGVVGRVVEFNAQLVVRSEPELRFGLGFVIGR